jgi:hypothetical protein
VWYFIHPVFLQQAFWIFKPIPVLRKISGSKVSNAAFIAKDSNLNIALLFIAKNNAML